MEILNNGTPVDPKRARINIVGGTFTDSASDDWTLLTLQVGDITGVTAGTGLSGGGTSGAISLAVNQAFTPTWTGLHTFNAHVALGANSNVSCAAGTTAVDLSLGTGTFKTPTGAHSINGAITMAANKGLAALAGTAGIDFSLATGAFKVGAASATIGFYGQTAAAQPSSTGNVTGFTAGAGAAVLLDSTFTGNVGSKAYTISDVVAHLKTLGLIASS